MRYRRYLLIALTAVVAVVASTGAASGRSATQDPPSAGSSEAATAADISVEAASQQPGEIDDRFGVVVTANFAGRERKQAMASLLERVGVRWYIDAGWDPATKPDGVNCLYTLPARSESLLLTPTRIAELVRLAPGAYWAVGNEANVPGMDNNPPRDYARFFHHYATNIKRLDPSAKLVGPNVLNWVDTCTGCPGYAQGQEWVDAFRDAYRTEYNQEPPIDVWALHTYDLDWEQLPMVNWRFQVRQITALRDYLEASVVHAGKPIWVTEFAVLFAFDAFEWRENARGAQRLYPVGDLPVPKLETYMREILGWLTESGRSNGVERWFFFESSRGEFSGGDWSGGFIGVSLLDGSTPDSQLTPMGVLYRSFATRRI